MLATPESIFWSAR